MPTQLDRQDKYMCIAPPPLQHDIDGGANEEEAINENFEEDEDFVEGAQSTEEEEEEHDDGE